LHQKFKLKDIHFFSTSVLCIIKYLVDLWSHFICNYV